MTMIVRAMIINQQEKVGKVMRHTFCPFFMDKIACNPMLLALIDHSFKFMRVHIGYNLSNFEFSFALVLFDDYWFWYVIETSSMHFYVIDSLVENITFTGMQRRRAEAEGRRA